MTQSSDDISKIQHEKATTLFLEYHQYVRVIAFRTAPSFDLIDDITNEVYLYFVKNADRWKFEGDLRPLLKTLTRNIALQFWRNHIKNLPESLGKIAGMLQVNTEAVEDPNEGEMGMELMALDLCVNKLSQEHRHLIEAFYFAKTKLTHLSETTGIKPGTLRKILCRVRTVLRQCVEKTLKGGQLHVE